MTSSNKNNERKSTIKGFIIDTENSTLTPFEFVSEYTRSNDKARKLAAKALNVDANFITISAIKNEKVERAQYNDGKVYEFARAIFGDIETAKNEYDEQNETVIPFAFYEYECQFWGFDGKDYYTDYVMDNSPLKMTRVIMREFLTNSAHELTGFEILAIHNEKRIECNYYAIVNNNDLEKCIEK